MEKIINAKQRSSNAFESIEVCTPANHFKFDKGEKLRCITKKIEAAINEKNINKSAFASLMGVQPSVVTRWLSGTHNFTIETLFDIEICLGQELVLLDHKSPIVTVRFVGYANDAKANLLTNNLNIEMINYEHIAYKQNNITYDIPKAEVINGSKNLFENA